MGAERTYRDFQYREAVFRICCDEFDVVTSEIVRQRHILEDYIARHEEFGRSFEPVEVLAEAPAVARQMAHAAELVGTGPMAAVAGTMAQFAAQAAIDAGAAEVIVENGGDIFLKVSEPAVIALYAGEGKLRGKLGFSLEPDDTPVAICSSSGLMGHSTSLGKCDLATVVSADAAIADAGATHAANLVKHVTDVDAALQEVVPIEGVMGVLIVKDDRVGLAGDLPRLVRLS